MRMQFKDLRHSLGGIGKRAFLCGVCMLSLCLYTASPWPAGASDGKGPHWNNMFFPRLTSSQEKSILSDEKKWLGFLMHRRKHEVGPLLSQGWQRECIAQDYIRQLTLKYENCGIKERQKKRIDKHWRKQVNYAKIDVLQAHNLTRYQFVLQISAFLLLTFNRIAYIGFK